MTHFAAIAVEALHIRVLQEVASRVCTQQYTRTRTSLHPGHTLRGNCGAVRHCNTLQNKTAAQQLATHWNFQGLSAIGSCEIISDSLVFADHIVPTAQLRP